MIVATHGRAIWILDHLEPIQEYRKATQTTADATLFTPPPFAWYQRPARDRNYEFWGDQTFFGENPPQAAVLSWLNKKPVGEVTLTVTDAAGRAVREISGEVLQNSKTAGIQSACWDLRVEPIANPDLGQPQAGRQGGGRQGGPQQPPRVNPFGAGCPGGGGGGFGGGAGVTPGPFVLPGVYNISLIVDGKTVDTKPLRVLADKEVVLTEVERRRLFDMAMELHALQRRANEAISAVVPVRRQMADVMKQVAAKADLPADVKTQAEAFDKELTALVSQVRAAGRARRRTRRRQRRQPDRARRAGEERTDGGHVADAGHDRRLQSIAERRAGGHPPDRRRHGERPGCERGARETRHHAHGRLHAAEHETRIVRRWTGAGPRRTRLRRQHVIAR